jgi:hypothetical protein
VYELSADDPQTDREWLMRIDEKLDGVIVAQAKMTTTISGDDGQGGLCARVSRLENFQNYILGAAAVIALVVPLVWNKIAAIFGGL